LVLNMLVGKVSRLPISFRWRMNNIGKIKVIAADFRSSQTQEGLQILYRMECCLKVVYTNSLIRTRSQLIQKYVSDNFYEYEVTHFI
jgi:hypothetical protein